MKFAITVALLLAGCSESLTSEEIDAASQNCLAAGAVPHIHYAAQSNEITRVTCEPK
jgi:hypothetical protein